MRCVGPAAAGFLAATLAAGSLAGQETPPAPLPTVVEGLTVDDQSGLPFPNVQLRFDTGERITSDEAGRYVIEGVAPGYHVVALVTGRCNVSFADLELAPGEIKRVAFRVPTEMVGLRPSQEEMKKRSEGEYYSREELADMKARDLLEALRRVAPDMVGGQGAQPGQGASLIGRTRTAGGAIPPLVVVDGLVMGDGERTLRDLRPADVYSLEVLRGAGRGWAYGTGGAGGVIKVETQAGEPSHGVAHPDRCDIGDWPAGRDDGPGRAREGAP
ncbi:MAG: hypothetical protein AMXMBFR53_12300 [Gemmatimonadota bacterium]